MGRVPEGTFVSEEVRQGVWRVSNTAWRQPRSTTNCWLVAGDERAVLIDAGMPGGGLRAYAESLVPKRGLRLVLTHGHFDHAGCLDEFDDFWASPLELEQLDGRDGLPGTPYHGRLHELAGGDVLELGGRSLDVRGVRGHTPGSLVLLDRRTRTLFSGDSVARRGFFPYAERLPLDVYLDDLLEVWALGYEWVASAHDDELLERGQLRHFVRVLVEGVEHPDSSFEVPGVGRFATIHAGKGVSDPDYVSCSIPVESLGLAREQLRAWRSGHAEWLAGSGGDVS